MIRCECMQQLQESTSRSTKGLRPFKGEGLQHPAATRRWDAPVDDKLLLTPVGS
jgi:hypothetical protein